VFGVQRLPVQREQHVRKHASILSIVQRIVDKMHNYRLQGLSSVGEERRPRPQHSVATAAWSRGYPIGVRSRARLLEARAVLAEVRKRQSLISGGQRTWFVDLPGSSSSLGVRVWRRGRTVAQPTVRSGVGSGRWGLIRGCSMSRQSIRRCPASSTRQSPPEWRTLYGNRPSITHD
jgi:hypothetical protein